MAARLTKSTINYYATTTESTQHTVKCTAREKLDATLLEILILGGAGPRDLRAGLSRLALTPP
mgnify:CR=1 FL=1